MKPRQQILFAAESPWEADDGATRLVAGIVFPTLPGEQFDYLVPDALCDRLAPGQRVYVPLGRSNRPVVGYCVRLGNASVSRRRLKSIDRLLDERSLLNPAMLRLTEWIADYYLCGWGQVLETVLPAGVRRQAGTRNAMLVSLASDTAGEGARSPNPKSQIPNPTASPDPKLTEKQLEILDYLAERGEPVSLAQLTRELGCSPQPIHALRRKGLVVTETRRLRHVEHDEPTVAAEEHHVLNPDQQRALDSILFALNAGQPRTVLLQGITGSGKTEVYIRAIEEVIRYGRQAIVLVPEISLTPQTWQRFKSRFGRVAVLHSRMTDSERHWQWERIAAGEVHVVVGARSAVFSPTPHLGLIVVDEEHETSFKQETAPRYHARDVALRRSQEERVPLVLGSATPSLESWHRAARGAYELIELPKRVFDRPLPHVATVDLREDSMHPLSRGAIGRRLERAMSDALEGGGQVILLLNRRGFATHIQCPACGHAVHCPNCEISLVYHRHGHVALCHYCDYQQAAPTRCPRCDFAGIRYRGLGTERLEAEVKTRFPDYPSLRMDTDTMRGVGAHERALSAFRTGDVRILLGTQMIAKGLDFPNVTLVGVVNADVALHFPDFRAAERTVQLLVQVAGRSGRGDKGGRVLIQTFDPDHPAIKLAVRHDYVGFARQELPAREELAYPPFATLVRVVVRGPHEKTAEQFAAHAAAELSQRFQEVGAAVRILGPAPAPIAKLRGRYRFHFQLHSTDGDALRSALRDAIPIFKPPQEVEWTVDVDPLDML